MVSSLLLSIDGPNSVVKQVLPVVCLFEVSPKIVIE